MKLTAAVAATFNVHISVNAINFPSGEVQLNGDFRSNFAMRVLRKKLIISKGQRDHVLGEGRILRETYCPFIVRCVLFHANPVPIEPVAGAFAM